MRVGFDVGFDKVSVSIFGQGVPRVLTAFPSVAAHSEDFSECFFGVEARGYQHDTGFTYVSCLRRAVFECEEKEDPSFSRLLEKLFAYAVKVTMRHGIRKVEGITMVLPYPFILDKGLLYVVTAAWKITDVNEVVLISDVTAIILSYTILSLDRKTLSKMDGTTTYLVVCNAGYNYFHMDIFEVIHNNHVVKFENYGNISSKWDSMQLLRGRLNELLAAKLANSRVSKLPDHIMEQLKEEVDRQITGFDEPKTQKVTIRVPYKNLQMVVTRDEYNAAVKPVISKIEEFVVASNAMINFGMADIGESRTGGNVEVLLVGKYSRLLPLREILETIQKPLNSRVSSYVDDAESFGAAVASCLLEPFTNVNKPQIISRLRQGVYFDMETILGALFPIKAKDGQLAAEPQTASLPPEIYRENGTMETSGTPLPNDANQLPAPTEIQLGPFQPETRKVIPSLSVSSEKFARISETQTVVFSGILSFGFPAARFCDIEFQLVLLTVGERNQLIHYVVLQHESKGKLDVFMRVVLGKRTRLFLDRTPNGKQYVRILTTFNGPTKLSWNELTFFPDEKKYNQDVYDAIMAEYAVRYDEMLTAFPEIATDGFGQIMQQTKSLAVIGRTPEILHSEDAGADRQGRFRSSIITLCGTLGRCPTLHVQQCQDILENGQVRERYCLISNVVECRQRAEIAEIHGIMDIVFPNPKLCSWFIKKLKEPPSPS